eukprot:TRINITY_DN3829_c1_g1_i1.p1 TRINITY_DN3829_c1_g1~~TRINITY_DN3829_c1_g1_i1.p1  ORF type:complete len:2092 (-),score=644.58 TRINITY_DN3829_c1_g1_i1:41-5551(-)
MVDLRNRLLKDFSQHKPLCFSLVDSRSERNVTLCVADDAATFDQFFSSIAETSFSPTVLNLDEFKEPTVLCTENGIVLAINKLVTDKLGYRKGHLLFRHIRALVPPTLHKKHDKYMHEFVSRGTSRAILGKSRAVMAVKGDGAIVPCTITISELFEGGERRFLAVIGPPRDQAVTSASSKRKVSRTSRRKKKNQFVIEMAGQQNIIEQRELKGISQDRKAAHMAQILEHGGSTAAEDRTYRPQDEQANTIQQRLPATSGSVYTLGCFETEVAMEVAKFLQRMAAGKKVKTLQAFLGVSGSRSRGLDELVLASDMITKASQIACGESSIAIIDDGEVYMCGAASLYHGCLGLRNAQQHKVGIEYFAPVNIGGNALNIESGSLHSLVCSDSGRVTGWGMNKAPPGSAKAGVSLFGLLGAGERYECEPFFLEGIQGRALGVACSSTRSAVFTTTGVYTFGLQGAALGRQGDHTIPGHISLDRRVVMLSLGIAHAMALTTGNEVYTWGSNRHGQLGVGKQSLKNPVPEKIASLSEVVCICAGGEHSMALRANGTVYSWGNAEYGALGIVVDKKGPKSFFEPLVIDTLSNFDVIDISCSLSNSLAVTAYGKVYIWGRLAGPDFSSHQPIPRLIEQIEDQNLFVTRADCGPLHYAFLADSLLTQLLSIFKKYANAIVEFKLEYIKTQICHVPRTVLKPVQDRALISLYEDCTEMKEKPKRDPLNPYLGLDPSLPMVSVDKYFLGFLPKRKTKQTVQLITVSNKSDKRLLCTFDMDSKELYQNSRYTFEFQPPSFSVEKKSSQSVRMVLRCNRNPSEMENYMFTMDVVRDRTSKRGTLKGDSSKKLHCVRHFFIAQVQLKEVATKSTGVDEQLVASLASYVPTFILKDLTRNNAVRTDPAIASFFSVILFIDISGFTALNERLGKLGPAGPELVCKHLNAYFGQLINAVTAHGGDVLKFAGDALICMFGHPECEENPETLSMRALQCALHIQDEYRQYDSHQGFVLTLHVGIGVGEMNSLFIGGVDGIWEFLVVGEPFLQLKTSVDASKAGEVVVSAQCWKLVKDRCTGEPRGGDVLVTAVNDAIEREALELVRPTLDSAPALRCYIPLGVQMRLDSKQGGWLAELRTVTVLFVKLNSLTYKTDEEFKWLPIHDALCFMQTVIFRYEGMVRQFLVDDKGTVLIAVFGVPPLAHEDDALRGVRTAISIHEELCRQQIDSSIGVTTGNVFCGSVGSGSRQEYAMVGDVVNLSARLMVAAGKMNTGVLCDEATHESVGGKFNFEKLNPIMVKGKSQPIRIYKPTSKTLRQLLVDNRSLSNTDAQSSVSNTVIGRDKEVASITNIITDMIDEQSSRVIIIEGDAGMGKTLLFHYFLELCQNVHSYFFKNHIQVVLGRAESVEKNSPFHCWKAILIQLLLLDLNLTDADGSAFQRVQLVKKLPQYIDLDLLPYVPLLSSILPLEVSSSHIIEKLTKRECKIYTRRLIKCVLLAAARMRPLLVLVDDFQFIDSASMELLYEVCCDALPNVLLMVASRPYLSAAPFIYKSMCALPHTQMVQLKSLMPAECEALVAKRLGVKSFAPEVLAEMNKGEGNPYFSEELITGMRDAGALNIDDEGHCSLKPNFKTVSLNDSVRSLVTSKIDLLGPEAQMVLKVASVIGIEFSKRLLAAVYPIPEQVEQIPAALRTLSSGGFVIKKTSLVTGTGFKGQYMFKTDICQRVAYSQMLYIQRQNLHRKVAMQLADEPAGEPLAHYKKIAWHWWKAFQGSTEASEQHVSQAIWFIHKVTELIPPEHEEELALWKTRLETLQRLLNSARRQEEEEEDGQGRRTRRKDFKVSLSSFSLLDAS